MFGFKYASLCCGNENVKSTSLFAVKRRCLVAYLFVCNGSVVGECASGRTLPLYDVRYCSFFQDFFFSVCYCLQYDCETSTEP